MTTTSLRTVLRRRRRRVALGFLAKRLGLTGPVTAEQLLRLLDGRHPITGKRLIAYRKDRVAGVDQTASAPKSVSVVWAVGRAGGAPRGRAGARTPRWRR